MKILWICNVVIPRIFKIRGEENSNLHLNIIIKDMKIEM